VILHGTFTAGQFVLWAEGLVTPTRRGKAGRHPFALPAKEVLTWAAERASLPNAHPGETVVWLPTEQDTPQPSPEVVAAGRAIPSCRRGKCRACDCR
jgi:hypothetical protein